jgi:ABC-type multidrug transport system fused ATPase/permease subunit
VRNSNRQRSVSGGQKARVSLARALYSAQTRIMLLDDPLSAVDAHVGEHIFKEAISGELAKGITRILVTHHVHVLSRCDKVIVMEHGRIAHQGKYSDLIEQGVVFAGAVQAFKSKNEDDEKPQDVDTAPVEENKDEKLSDEKKAALTKSGKNLVRDEEREEGAVDGSAYTHYVRAGGWFTIFMVFFVSAVGRASEIMSGFWLSIWAQNSFAAQMRRTPLTKHDQFFYLGIYALFGMVGVLGLTARSILIAMHRLRASKKLHDELTASVLRAPVAFFDITPIGRILNRFAADMDKIDLELTQSLSQAASTVFNILGAIAAMVAATKGTFLIPLVPIGYIYYVIQKWFRKTSTELQRINSIANSPIFADFSQTLSGTSTIRAYGEDERFFKHCQSSFDNQNVSFLLVQVTGNWLGLRLDFLGGLMGAFIGGVAVGTSSSGFISAGWLGLALMYSIEVTNYLKFGIRMLATIEAQMNSVERVLYYTNNIAEEAPEYVPGNDPKDNEWPTEGKIEIKHASMRYRDGPIVLKDLSLTVQGGEKMVCVAAQVVGSQV